MSKKYLFLIFLHCLFFSLTYAHAQNVETGAAGFLVEGSAKIKRDDLAAARDEAIQNALEKAIIEAAAKLPVMSVSQEDFKLVKNIITREPHKYVLYYSITEEAIQPQDFRIKANVVVAVSALKNDLNKMGFLNRNVSGQNAIKILLTVKGITTYAGYLRIKDFLQSRAKVIRNMHPARFVWQEAQFELDVLVEAQYLADELAREVACAVEIKYAEQNSMEMICSL